MPRPKIYNDEEKILKKYEANNKPINIEKRRINSSIYYEKKKLKEYILKNDNDEGFIYKHTIKKII